MKPTVTACPVAPSDLDAKWHPTACCQPRPLRCPGFHEAPDSKQRSQRYVNVYIIEKTYGVYGEHGLLSSCMHCWYYHLL